MNPRPEGDQQISLPSFFRTLAGQIERGELSNDRLLNASEMCMYYTAREELDSMTQDEIEALDLVKALALGFYVYKILKVNPSQTQDDQAPSPETL